MDMPSSVPMNPGAALVAGSGAHNPADHAGAGSHQHHPGNSWLLALTALGVVYGDIGTSPLYAFFLNRIASRAPDFFKIPSDAVIEVGFRVEI